MSLVEPPPQKSSDDLEGLLRAFFRSQMPQPWPSPRVPVAPVVPFRRSPRIAWNLIRSRGALAASVALLLLGSLLLPSRFTHNAKPDNRIGAPAISSRRHSSKDGSQTQEPRIRQQEQTRRGRRSPSGNGRRRSAVYEVNSLRSRLRLGIVPTPSRKRLRSFLRRHQSAQCGQINDIHVHLLSLFLRRFQDHRSIAKAPIVDEKTERLQSHFAAANVSVAIHPASPRLATVIDVERTQAAQSNGAIESPHGRPILGGGCQRVAGREDVAGVETHTQTIRFRDQRENARQVLEAMAERATLPSCCFQKHPYRKTGCAAMNLIEGGGDTSQPRLLAAIEMRPGCMTR